LRWNIAGLDRVDLLDEWSGLAFHGITKGSLSFFEKSLLARDIGSFALTGLCHEEGIMSSSLSGLE
jgi:hypothetical protein